MSYQIPDKATLDSLLDYVAYVLAALGAEEGTAAMQKPWLEARAALLKARDERDLERWALYAASAKVKVIDTRWDAHVTNISGRAYLAAGKQGDAEPYKTLFGAVTAKDATGLGPHKASAVGETLVTKLAEQKHAELAPFGPTLVALNSQLKAAGEARRAQLNQTLVHEVRRVQWIDDMEALVARTEVALLTLQPGNSKLVRAVLAWGEQMGSAARPAKPASTAVGAEVEIEATEG